MNKNFVLKSCHGLLAALLFSTCVINSLNGQSNAPKILPGNYIDKADETAQAINVPITFYGKVIDQSSNPLSGVVLSLRVQRPYFDPIYLFKAQYLHIKRITDQNGAFQLADVTGKGVNIETIDKSGYELELNAMRDFGSVSGSVDSPVIFKMWDTNIHEKLIIGEKRFHIRPDGRAYVIDLLGGTISESGNGDLKVWIKYDDAIPRGRTNSWACGIEILNGGLKEESHSDSSMYSAPAGSYEPTFLVNQSIKSGQSGSSGSKRFYLKLKGGQMYGRAVIELIAPYNDRIPGLVKVGYVINPSGSRVLK